MKNTKPAGFYVSVEDLEYLDRIMCLLSGFVNIILDQTIEELDKSITAANRELRMEEEDQLY
jgi:uncharacterized Fe-S cluster-containing protein